MEKEARKRTTNDEDIESRSNAHATRRVRKSGKEEVEELIKATPIAGK